MPSATESERLTRKRRIDPRLDARGWRLPAAGTRPLRAAHRTEEEPTTAGPADYALWLDGRVVGVVEAKRVTLGSPSDLTQAERYARGLPRGHFDFDGLRCPFLYATNGEVLWFRDARHPLTLSRAVADFHTPAALGELLERDHDAACDRLHATPNGHPLLRPYQKAANAAIEQAIASRKRHLLVAMATGTGKTLTLVNQVYRLLKAGVAKRVLFLVDRRALAAQAVRAFAAFEAEPGLKLDQIYEVYSSRFQREELDEGERFDPKVLPTRYLTDPQPGDTFVYVATIQRMAIHVLGRQAVFGSREEAPEEDADRLDIPIHAFDLVIADECHRGYTAQEISVWRATLDHFDAVKVGLTATPAAHTAAYFSHKVYEYGYAQAVRDGYLVDYDVVNVRSEVRMHGVFLHEGERVEVVDPGTGMTQLDLLEDERQFDTGDLEQRVTAPASNRKILEEVKRYADAHEARYGRFPKTLIFAVNDLPHTSHADQLVELAREVLARGEDFVAKITGRVDRPLKRIREFRNRPRPGVVVTVDLLTTGVDIPDLEFLVLLRPVRSRILFEQILGRGTRKGEHFPDKTHFTVFDCFDGTLLAYFRKATGITAEPPVPPSRTLAEVVQAIWDNQDRDYNVGCLVKRLHRLDRELDGAARERLAAQVPGGDLAGFARTLPKALAEDFVATMHLLRDPGFLETLSTYRRPREPFLRAPEQDDTVTSIWTVRDGDGNLYQPEDYLAAFARFVRENEVRIAAIQILLDRPRDWSTSALQELRDQLARSRERFTEDHLRTAHEVRYHKALVDIISMVKHAADAQAPLLDAGERVRRAVATVSAGRVFTAEQQAWLDRIARHLETNLAIERDHFDAVPVLQREGGWGAARRAFGERALDDILHQLNEAMAA